MSKLRSNSAWTQLTAEQRAKLEGGVFEKHLGYREALELVKREFGMATSLTSLRMFCGRLARERKEREATDQLRALMDPKKADGATLAEIRAGGEKLTALRACEVAIASPERVRELTALCRVVTRQQRAELERSKLELLREEVKGGDNKRRELPPKTG